MSAPIPIDLRGQILASFALLRICFRHVYLHGEQAKTVHASLYLLNRA